MFVSLVVAAVAATLPSAAPAAVSVGHSPWEWGNPRPQGNGFLSIEFRGTGEIVDRGYAGGTFGTLLRTDDAGATWTGLSTGITADVEEIEVIGADSVVAAAGCALRRSDDAGTTFRRVPWTPRDTRCPSQIGGIAFPSSDVGYVVTDSGTVLRSADGGRSWSRRTALPGTPATNQGGATARDIAFFSADVGIAVIGAGGGGAILRTIDGGASWTLVRSAPARLNDVWLHPGGVDALVVGDNGLVYRSTDSGQTWEERPVPVGTPPRNLISADCADRDTCIVTKQQGDELYRTTDGGATWTPVTPSTEPVLGVAFASPTRAVAVGAAGVTVVSDDAGGTWARIGDSLAGSFRSVRASSNSLAFALGDAGTLARTTDSGETWAPIGVPSASAIVDVSFPSAAVGYALDGAGTLFRTENGGASWEILNTGTTAVPRAVVALDEATVLLVGPRGVRRSTDAGQTFDVIGDRVVRSQSLDSIDRAGPALFVWGPRGRILALSQTGGRTWRRIPRVPPRRSISEYDWVSPRVGFALGVDGRAWRTRDGGRRWTELATTGTERGFDLAFSSPTEGYLAIEDYPTSAGGYVLRTIDGGRTWRPQLLGEGPVRDVAAPGGGTDFALIGPVSLLRSSQVAPQARKAALTLTPKRGRRSRRGARPRRRATVQLNGRLTPPEGAERVVVSSRPLRGARWRRQVITVASSGRFTVTKTITGPTIFVAQWEGDDDRSGAASRAVVVAPR